MKRFIGLLALVLAGCASQEPVKEEHGHEEEALSLTQEQSEIAGIETASVGKRSMQPILEIPGVVSSTTKGRALITPPVAGRVTRLDVDLGATVRKGQTLGVIESPDLALAWSAIAEAQRAEDSARAQVKDAAAQIELAKAKLASAQQTLVRQRQLAEAGAFSQAAVQLAQSELSDAQSDLLSVQKEQAAHAEQLRRIENLFKEGIVSKLDLDNARLELQQDDIRLSRARARVDIAKRGYERERNIAEQGLMNRREIQTAEADVQAARLERDRLVLSLRSAKASLASASKAVGNAQSTYRTYGAASQGRVTLIAPIDGTLTKLDVSRGQAVDRTQAIAEIEDLSSVWITASVPERDAAKAKVGAKVKVTLAALPDVEFDGVVQIVGSKIDPRTRAIPIQCLVTGTQGRLKPEMFATVRLGYGQSRSALSIPTTAIVDKTFVFVKEGEGFERRSLTLGTKQGGFVEVVSGLKEGETIATQGAFVLESQRKKDELKGHED